MFRSDSSRGWQYILKTQEHSNNDRNMVFSSGWRSRCRLLFPVHIFHVILLNVCFFLCINRSMQKLTQLERLDLGSNEFAEVVSVCHRPKRSTSLEVTSSLPSFRLQLEHTSTMVEFLFSYIHPRLTCSHCALSASAAWGLGAPEWTQRAVAGWEQTDLSSRGMTHRNVFTHWSVQEHYLEIISLNHLSSYISIK